MSRRLLAFVLLSVAWAIPASLAGVGIFAPQIPQQSVPLVPGSLAGRQIDEHWINSHYAGRVEEGASYVAPGKDTLQLDFYRYSLLTHNGILCFLMTGEKLVQEESREIRLQQGSAQFEVALLRNADTLRLVASTECNRNGCAERPNASQQPGWYLTFIRQESSSAVPVSLVLASPVGGDSEAAVISRLNAELIEAAAALDLRPAMQQAALQQ